MNLRFHRLLSTPTRSHTASNHSSTLLSFPVVAISFCLSSQVFAGTGLGSVQSASHTLRAFGFESLIFAGPVIPAEGCTRLKRWMLVVCSVLVFVQTAQAASSQSRGHSAAGSTPGRVTHIAMHHVLFRAMDNVVLQVDSLQGVLAPTRRHGIISLDDKNSFSVDAESAKASISSADLAALANGFILPRAKTPLSNLRTYLQSRSVDFCEGRLSQGGRCPIFGQSHDECDCGWQHANALVGYDGRRSDSSERA